MRTRTVGKKLLTMYWWSQKVLMALLLFYCCFVCLFFIRGCIIFWRRYKGNVLICYLTKTQHLTVVPKRLFGFDCVVFRTIFDFTLPNSKNRLSTEKTTQIIAVKDATKEVATL